MNQQQSLRFRHTMSGSLVLGISTLILVMAFAIGGILAFNNYTKRVDSNTITVNHLQEIILSLECQQKITASYYQGIGLVFANPVEEDGTVPEGRTLGIEKIVAAGVDFGNPKNCRP